MLMENFSESNIGVTENKSQVLFFSLTNILDVFCRSISVFKLSFISSKDKETIDLI